MKQKWFCEACKKGGEADVEADGVSAISAIHEIAISHHSVSPDCEFGVYKVRVEGTLEIRKGDLVRNSNGDIGVVVTMGPSGTCLVFWGNGLTMEGPISDLVPVPFSPESNITASFVEMANRCYPDHMTWLREGSPGSGRFA